MKFIQNRRTFYSISSILLILSVIAFLVFPKNLGIDMTGGIQVEYDVLSVPGQAALSEVKESFLEDYRYKENKALSDINIYSVNDHSIRADIGLLETSDATQEEDRIADIRAQLLTYFSQNGIQVTETQFVSVGKSFGKFVLDRAYWTLGICLIGIALYLMFAFRHSIDGLSSLNFGVTALITLMHDVLIAC